VFAAEARHEHDGRQALRSRATLRRSRSVGLLFGATHARNVSPNHRHCDDAKWQVHEENPAPGELIDEESSDQRRDHRGGCPGPDENPLVTPTLAAAGNEVADHRIDRSEQPTAADSLQTAKRESTRACFLAEARTNAEASKKITSARLPTFAFRPVEVAELPPDRAGSRRA